MTSTGKNRLAFSTRTVHGGQSHDPTTGAVMVPIYATSTYAQHGLHGAIYIVGGPCVRRPSRTFTGHVLRRPSLAC